MVSEKPDASLVEFYKDFLSEEGFRPSIDEDGDVIFKFEGGTYWIRVDENDRDFFQVQYFFGYEIESQEEFHRATAACMDITRQTKVVKIMALEKHSSFLASAEAFYASPEDVKKVFPRILSCIQGGINSFLKAMKEE
jgi:hypothetical protein